MILQANFHYEIDNKEKLASTSCKNGNDLYTSLLKHMIEIKYKIIYLDNTFQKVFAISEVELIKLPDNQEDLENFIDVVFHTSCQKGINTIAFHLRKVEITNQAITIYKSEKILQILQEVYAQKGLDQQDKQEQQFNCYALRDLDYKNMIRRLNYILYSKENFQDLTKEQQQEQEQIFSLIIQRPNSNRNTLCIFENKIEIVKVLSNFQIDKAQLYETNLAWAGEKREKAKPKLFLNAQVIESKKMKNGFTFETTIKVDHNQKSQNHLMFVLNQKVLAFQFPLKFGDYY
ncbi:unnamed protein product [Paramecium primaurelia]|uniref:Uncharacterized protein n=1 Tax=Paramecium primaurelia TaxID=5886 RepID=A0A8S1NL57_PARPR|nr:unnamed protein product [Paramecium primaurelia]